MHLRGRQGIGVVLHCGARAGPRAQRLPVRDPAGMLDWLANDRAMVRFADTAEVEARREAFQALLRDWLACL